MVHLTVKNTKLALGVVLATCTLVSGVALAGTANTPVGQLTATQYSGPCNDLGANVAVSVTKGFASTAYTAAAPIDTAPAKFTTNATGAGEGTVQNVNPGTQSGKGTVTITVKANGKVGKVPVYVVCLPGGGK